MDSTTIKQSIAAWTAILTQADKLVYYFEQGNSFSYEFIKYPEPSEHVHAYLGIYEGRLYFFLIPSAYDKEEYSDDIALYTSVCMVGWWVQGSDRITAAVAKGRIRAWENNYQTWVPKDVVSEFGMFQAFVIPVQDFESEISVITLGLEENPSATAGFEGDLIIANEDGKITVYDDFVRPIPPYGVDAFDEENFYLLH